MDAVTTSLKGWASRAGSGESETSWTRIYENLTDHRAENIEPRFVDHSGIGLVTEPFDGQCEAGYKF